MVGNSNRDSEISSEKFSDPLQTASTSNYRRLHRRLPCCTDRRVEAWVWAVGAAAGAVGGKSEGR